MRSPLRRPLSRIAALTLASVTIAGVAAVADTSSVPVTLGVVNGSRTLQVTGVDDGTGLPAGPASLAFGPNTTSSPFGVVVADLAYERAGYDVTATLTDLFKLNPAGTDDPDGTHDCGAMVPSGAFAVAFGSVLDPTDVEAIVEPLLTFTDVDVLEDLGDLGFDLTLLSVLGLDSTSTLPVTVEDLGGLVSELPTSVLLMDVGQGVDAGFAAAAAHPACAGSGAGAPTSLTLQTGEPPAAPDLSSHTTALFEAADGTGTDDDVLSPVEAIGGGLLPPGAADAATSVDADDGGYLWEATESAVRQVLADSGILDVLSITDSDLLNLTSSVVADLTAGVGDLVLDLIGQTGVYANLPTLELDTEQLGDATTGLYHGVMTVTLADR